MRIKRSGKFICVEKSIFSIEDFVRLDSFKSEKENWIITLRNGNPMYFSLSNKESEQASRDFWKCIEAYNKERNSGIIKKPKPLRIIHD